MLRGLIHSEGPKGYYCFPRGRRGLFFSGGSYGHMDFMRTHMLFIVFACFLNVVRDCSRGSLISPEEVLFLPRGYYFSRGINFITRGFYFPRGLISPAGSISSEGVLFLPGDLFSPEGV